MDTSILTNNGVDINRGLELLGDMEFYNETLGQFLDTIEENKNKKQLLLKGINDSKRRAKIENEMNQKEYNL